MIQALALLLSFQLIGEVAARALNLPLPGPVLGMLALVFLFILLPRAQEIARPVATALLANLSLLFVPAGVGIVGHLDRLGNDGAPILLAIVVSTGLAIGVGAVVFSAVARIAGVRDD